MKESVKSVTSSESSGSWVRYCVAINSLQHVLTVLQEWNESLLFLKLNFAVRVRSIVRMEAPPECVTRPLLSVGASVFHFKFHVDVAKLMCSEWLCSAISPTILP